MAIFTKNSLQIFALPILTSTFITNSMEIIPCKKFEKTENSIRNYHFADKDIELKPTNERPLIKTNLYIDDRNTVVYAGSEYIKSMNKAGIRSLIQNQQKMPLIPVVVIIDSENWNWVNNIPKAIQDYERTRNLTTKEREKEYSKTSKKRFPHSIPADLLYEHKTGDSINLTVHGYPVIATCSDNPRKNLPFKEHFTRLINNFIKRPRYVMTLLNFERVEKELIEAGLIDDEGTHGPNGFISIDKLLLEDKNIPNMFNYLKQREMGYGTSKIPSQEKFPLITRDAFVPQQIDIDNDQNGQVVCVIS